jgi:hypothetical protein
MPDVPEWLALLVPLPLDVKPERKPVASAEQLAQGTAGPIAGWQSVTVNLSEPAYGLRHVQITLDEHGQLLAGGDHVMFVRETTPDGIEATLTDHESVGGRFEPDGSFRGTYSKLTLESPADSDDDSSIARSAENRPPSVDEVEALRRIIADVLNREPWTSER